MNIRHSALAVTLSAVTILALAGCAPSLPEGPSDDSSGGDSVASSEASSEAPTEATPDQATPEGAIVDTLWAGTDSDGDEWKIRFQEGGGIAFSYEGSRYDDDNDTWTLEGSTLTITMVFDEATAYMTGEFIDAETTISLDGQIGESTWTLDLEPA
jgi:hypothetical protein